MNTSWNDDAFVGRVGGESGGNVNGDAVGKFVPGAMVVAFGGAVARFVVGTAVGDVVAVLCRID